MNKTNRMIIWSSQNFLETIPCKSLLDMFLLQAHTSVASFFKRTCPDAPNCKMWPSFVLYFSFNFVRIMQEKEVKRWLDHIYKYLHRKTTSNNARLFNLRDKWMVQFSSWKLKLNKIKLEMHCKSLAPKVRTMCAECIFHHSKPLTQEKPLSLSKTYVSSQPEIAWTITGISGYNSMAFVRQKIRVET